MMSIMAIRLYRHYYFMKLNYEHCLTVARGFSTKRDFREKANSEFQWLHRNDLLGIACSHMEVLRRELTDEAISEIASRYTHRRAFKLADQSAYNAAKARGILDRVCSHMNPVRRSLTDAEISSIARKFSSRSEFADKDYGAYQSAASRGILDAVCGHMNGKVTRRLSDDEILSIAKQFSTRNDFKLGDFGAYTTAIRRGLIEAACEHMEYGACGFREDRPAVLYQFRIETPGGDTLYKVGITNRKPRQRLTTMGIKRGVSAELTDFIRFDSGRDARIEEKRLHREFKPFRYLGQPILKNGNTEVFTVPLIAHCKE